jgi:succinate dehydrogenase hydrophobic anchor subunit
MATSVIHVFVLLFYLATESKHATENCHNPAMNLTVIIIIIIFLHMENAWRAARLHLATATSSISF